MYEDNFNDLKKNEDDINLFGVNIHLTKKQKKIIVVSVVAIVAIIILCVRSCAVGSSQRKNTISLAKMYMDKGEYNRALDKIENLLLKNANDRELLDLMDEIIAAKENAEKDSAANANASVSVNVDTEDLTHVIESMKSSIEQNNRDNRENSRAMADLLNQQKKQAELDKANAEEQKRQAKLAEEQRKKEDAAKKAQEEQRKKEEEALKKKNAQLAKEISSVNDEIQQGKTALQSGNINSSLEHFKKAAEELPVSDGEPAFSSSKYSEMATFLYAASENADSPENKKILENSAIDYAKKALSLNPHDAPSNFIVGKEAMDKKDYKKALGCFTEAVNYDNKNYLYYYNLGRAQYMMKKYTEAKYSFNTSCTLNGSFAPARYNLGLTNNRLNDSKSALSDFRKAHNIDPQHEKAYVEEARVLVGMSDYNGAIYAYNKATALNSTNRIAFQELGSAYFQVKKYSDAESSFRKSLALLPSGQDDPLTYYNLSTVLFEEGKTDDAITYAKKAYETQSLLKDSYSRANLVYNYALICEANGKEDDAISLYSEVLKLNPSHLKTQVNLGVMYMKMNPPDTQMALSLFTKAYNQDKNNFEANNNLGSAYLTEKDYKNAILYFQNALKIDSKNNDVRSNLAQAFASDCQYDNAKTTYLELLRQMPDNWDGYVELGKVCLALNDNENAEKYLTYVQVKNPSYRSAEVKNLLDSMKTSTPLMR